MLTVHPARRVSAVAGVAVGLLLGAGVGPLGAAGPAEYTFVDLGTLGGTESKAFGLNAAGQVVGYAKDAAGVSYAFRTAAGGGIDPATDNLGPLAAGYTSAAFGINGSGRVVGQGGTAAGDRAWVYDAGGGMTALGTLGGDWSFAYAVNAAGQVTGGAARPRLSIYRYPTHAFLYSGGQMYGLGTLGGDDSYGRAINAGGAVAGYSSLTINPYYGYAPTHAFVWRPGVANGTSGTMTDLGTLGGLESYAFGINDAGEVVGAATTNGEGAYRAFLVSTAGGGGGGGGQGTMVDLGTLGGTHSEARGINNKGHVVGWADTSAGTAAAFVRTGGGMRDLNRVGGAGAAGWVLTHAEAVTDAGQVVGHGTAPDGQTRGYVLTPIPTWAKDADAGWSAAAHWSTPAAPNGPGATANLTGAITAGRTVTLDVAVTLGRLNFAGAQGYRVAGPGTLAIGAGGGGGGGVRVYEGHHEIAAALDVGTAGASLRVDDGAGLTLSGAVSGTLAGLTLGTGSRLDLAGGGPLEVSTGTVSVAEVVGWIAGGYNGGAWDGAGIASTAAARDPQRVWGLGYRADGAAVTVLAARYGDADLDGRISAEDYTLVDRGMAMGLGGWGNGDFDYDGAVTPGDYLLMDRAFVAQAGGLSPDLLAVRESQFGSGYVAELVASVPEPGAAGAGGVAAMYGLAARRRRRG